MSTDMLKAVMLLLDSITDPNRTIIYTRASFKDALAQREIACSDPFITKILYKLTHDYGVALEFKDGPHNQLRIIDEDQLEVMNNIYRLKGMLGIELFSENLKKFSSMPKYMQTDFTENSKGLQWIDTILEAIMSKRYINLTHKRFEKEAISKHEKLKPHFIKEYQNKWYMVVEPIKGREYTTFGLDRILELKVLNETYELDQPINFNLFDDAIGVDLRDEVAEVRLRFDQELMNYVLITPLHQSQKIETQDENSLVLSLKVKLNNELKRTILAYGSHVEVLEPASLRKYIAEEMHKGLAIYS